jgi:tetratricopeptide (TPR) repeat protein
MSKYFSVIMALIFLASCGSRKEKKETEVIDEISSSDIPKTIKVADSLLRIKDYASAIPKYTSVIKLDSSNDYAMFQKAIALSELEKYEEANLNYDKVVKLNSKFQDSAFFKMGVNLLELKKYPHALMIYNQILTYDSMSHAVYRNRGICFYNIGQLQNACSDFKKAFALGDTSLSKPIRDLCAN